MKQKKKENVDNKAYKYRLYPTNEQAVMINKTFGCVRFVYNQMLANRMAIYDQFKEDKEAMKQQKYALPADYKKEFEWLKEVDSLALANAQLNLQTAYQNFFRDKSIGFPKFKSKHHDRKSYTTNNQKGSIRLINDNTIRLPKLKDVRIRTCIERYRSMLSSNLQPLVRPQRVHTTFRYWLSLQRRNRYRLRSRPKW